MVWETGYVKLSDIVDEALMGLGSIAAYAGDAVDPTIRLGVTGLSGAGKTVFITSLVHNLVAGGRLPLFDVAAEGRFKRAYLQPQPDDDIPRFEYEKHLSDILENRVWPESTKRISQLRLTIEFEPVGFWGRNIRGGKLNIDIVDYPGEWLLDLPLLNWSFGDWAQKTIALSRKEPRKKLAKSWHKLLEKVDAAADSDEALAREMAEEFTAYLRASRDQRYSLSALPPGRFLMPGDLKGSPALTFAPLIAEKGLNYSANSLHAMMERRFESYKSVVVKPFYRNHFARLDRQVILVDALGALNAGTNALQDLETALTDILASFRIGANSWLSSVLARRVDKILVAATKADHLHHDDHVKLENIARQITATAIKRAEFAGADIRAMALSGVRATREAIAKKNNTDYPMIAGTPVEGEKLGNRKFDGDKETAIFPGDLPENSESVFQAGDTELEAGEIQFVKFRPPEPLQGPGGIPILPHIRLDKALNFLAGDKLE